jgi:hypothetical protein
LKTLKTPQKTPKKNTSKTPQNAIFHLKNTPKHHFYLKNTIYNLKITKKTPKIASKPPKIASKTPQTPY